MWIFSLLACQDYNLQGDPDVYGTPNPPDLSIPTQVDRITQVPVPSVDVLWIVDNSCSMVEEQRSLTDSFGKFMNYFLGSGLDYHVGVTSTDMDTPGYRGELREANGVKWIEEGTADPIRTFKTMARMGTDGSADEKGRAAAYTALELKRDGVNAGFLREDAYLSVIVISDENDYSGTNPISLDGFVDWLSTVKAEPDSVTFSSIVGPEGGCSSASGDAEAGREYLRVTRQVGGIEWSICDSDYEQMLEELGVQAAGLKREFFLSQVPVPGTVSVWVMEGEDRKDFAETTDWVYDRNRNSVQFATFVPVPLSQVFIEYQLLSSWSAAQDDTDAAE
jgi:hypothetical protein